MLSEEYDYDETVEHLKKVFGDRVTLRSYFDAASPELAEPIIEQAVADGAQVLAVGGIGVNLDFAAPAGGPAWEISLTNLKRKR